jgi:hypothetical protein
MMPATTVAHRCKRRATVENCRDGRQDSDRRLLNLL